MSKLRIVYIVSLLILGVLVAFVVFRPMATGEEYSEVSRESLLQTENGWILQFVILNREGKDRSYTIEVSVDGKPSTITVPIRDGEQYTYVRQIRSEMLSEGVVSYTIYKEGETTPFEQGTYYLDFD